MSTLKTWAAAAALLALTGAAQAALVSLGDGTVEDTNTNLIWLQNWNVNGLNNWATQKAWAETTLDGFAGSNDWRLPEIGEYAALFTAYGNLSQVTAFMNVQPNAYWSGTEFAPDPSLAWHFAPNDLGSQFTGGKFNALRAVAVRPGDVTASVPEPQTLALALLALGAMVVARTRRSR
jgi:hypothetical protein